MHVVYLHGFASSSGSSKAAFFRERFASNGIPLVAPDFNAPDFEHLTVTRMLGQVRDVLSGLRGPAALIGSSLGAFVAVHAAAAQDKWQLPAAVDRLVLLAPALEFGTTRFAELGKAGLARWKATGRLDVFHHALNRTLPLAYDLYEDAARYDSFSLALDVPTLIFQGSRDEVVNPGVAARWADRRRNVTVRSLDDDHQLHSSLERIWPEIFGFVCSDYSSERRPLG